MRIVAFGCSHTYGQGLYDCVDKNDFRMAGPTASKFAFPQIIANRLRCECINLALPGSSNKLIWHRAINFDYEKDDIVLILWSQMSRYCVFQDDKKYKNINPWDDENNFFYQSFYSDYDSAIDFLLRSNHLKHRLDGLGVKSLQMFIDPILIVMPRWNNVSFIDIKFDDIHKRYPQTEDGHPGRQAHIEIARKIKQNLKL